MNLSSRRIQLKDGETGTVPCDSCDIVLVWWTGRRQKPRLQG